MRPNLVVPDGLYANLTTLHPNWCAAQQTMRSVIVQDNHQLTGINSAVLSIRDSTASLTPPAWIDTKAKYDTSTERGGRSSELAELLTRPHPSRSSCWCCGGTQRRGRRNRRGADKDAVEERSEPHEAGDRNAESERVGTNKADELRMGAETVGGRVSGMEKRLTGASGAGGLRAHRGEGGGRSGKRFFERGDQNPNCRISKFCLRAQTIIKGQRIYE